MPLRRIVLLVLTILIGLAIDPPPTLGGDAPPPDLVTDRPDQTESASVVSRGFFQLETGWTHAEQKQGGVRGDTDGFPETLARIGLTHTVELRVGCSGHRWEELQGSSRQGAGDSSVGLKVGLSEAEGRRPQSALIAQVSLPTGDSDFSSERADPAFRFAFAHGLTERLSLGYNAGVAWSTGSDAAGERDTLSVFLWTATVGIGATDRLGAFIELFGESGLSAGGSPANSLDGGVTYLLRGNLQLDLFAGTGLSDAADDWFAGVGLSYRFPE